MVILRLYSKPQTAERFKKKGSEGSRREDTGGVAPPVGGRGQGPGKNVGESRAEICILKVILWHFYNILAFTSSRVYIFERVFPGTDLL
jgi:hypothetical protein